METKKVKVEIVKGKHSHRVIDAATGKLIAKMRAADFAQYMKWNPFVIVS